MKLSFRDRPIVFIDLEASGLDRHSFPVEIGWCGDDDIEPPPSFLIRPNETWPETDAYHAGFAVHDIPYADLLARGVHLLDLPRRLDAAWTDAILTSDNVLHDTRWLRRAYDAIGRPMPWQLTGFDVIFATLSAWSDIPVADVLKLTVAAKRLPVPHRAGADARRMHRIARALVDPDWRAILLDPDMPVERLVSSSLRRQTPDDEP